MHTISIEPGAGMQPSLVVEEVRLTRLQTDRPLMTKGCCLEFGQVRQDERAPPGERVQPQPDGDAPVEMRGEDLRRMPVAGAEVGRTRPGEDVRGLTGFALQQVRVHAEPVAEQTFPSALGGLGADQQHQAWGMGKSGAFRVGGEFAVAESGISGPACVAWDAADRGQSVGVAVPVCGHRHDSGGERQHVVARSELVEGDETVLAQLLGDQGGSAWGSVIEEVRSEKITGAHRRAPSSAVSGSTVGSGGPAGKATDCRLG